MPNCTTVDETLQNDIGLESQGFVAGLLPKFVNVVRTARRLPVGEEHAIRRASRDFMAGSKEVSGDTLALAHRALKFLDPGSFQDTRSEELSNFNIVVDSIDNVLERVDACLQDALAEPTPGSPADDSAAPASQQYSSGPAKPQVKWRQLVDNHRTRFVPRIQVKHNHAVPLQPEIVEAQEAAGIRRLDKGKLKGKSTASTGALPHPYEPELVGHVWGETDFKPVEPQLYGRMEDTPLVFVSTEAELREMIDEIKATCVGQEIAVDVEHHDSRTYRGFVCLVQVSSRLKDWVIDPFDIFQQMHMLNEIFSDAQIVKVLHGADRDVIWLQRDFSIYFVNMFDTGQATRTLRLSGGFGLANLVSYFCGLKLDKKYQMADWRQRPLSEELTAYARCDTHYLLYCFDRLRNMLLTLGGEAGDGATAKGEEALQTVLDNSTALCRQLHTEEPFKAEAEANRLHTRFGSRGPAAEASYFESLKRLAAWRDALARRLDESCGFVCPDACLWRIALAAPSTVSRLRGSCNPLPALVQEYAAQVVEIVSGPAGAQADGAAASPERACSQDAGPHTPASPEAQSASAAAAEAGFESPRDTSPVAFSNDWPAPQVAVSSPVVHVAAATGGSPRPQPVLRQYSMGTMLAMLSGAADSSSEDSGDDAACEEPSPGISPATTAALGDKLRGIQDTMTFLAVPPEKPDCPPVEPDAETENGQDLEAPAVPNGIEEPVVYKVRSGKKRNRASKGGACLERAVMAVAPTGAAANPAAEQLVDAESLKKKKRKKGGRQHESKFLSTTIDPYL